MVFDGFPPDATCLTAGYQLDAADAGIRMVIISKSISRTKNEWVIDLRELAAGVTVPNVQPLTPQQPVGTTTALPRVGRLAEKKVEGGSLES